MNNDKLYELLKKIENGQATADDVMQQLKTLPFDDMGYASRGCVLSGKDDRAYMRNS